MSRSSDIIELIKRFHDSHRYYDIKPRLTNILTKVYYAETTLLRNLCKT